MQMLLSTTVEQWILLGVLLLILVLSPIFMMAKNKKAMANTQKMIDELKKGDTILTTAGVIGKVISIENKDGYKTVTIETGDEKHKGYMCIDVASIYYNLTNVNDQQNIKENVKADSKLDMKTNSKTNKEEKESQLSKPKENSNTIDKENADESKELKK